MSAAQGFQTRPQTAAPEPRRGLWQVPTFFLGLLAVVLVYWYRPGLPTSPAQRAERGLHEALQALDAGEYARARDLAREALDHTEAAPEFEGDLRFVLGSALILDADQSGAPQADACARARLHLHQARQLGVSPVHEPRLNYRILLNEFHTGADATVLAPPLEKTLELHQADRVDGYRVLVALWLRKSPPNFEAALRANEKLLAQPHLTDPNPARLQHGELLLKLKRKSEARTALARIPREAPEYSPARHLRAQSAFEEEQWSEALALWHEAVQQDAKDSASGRQGRLFLGLCHAHLNQRTEAVAAWTQLGERSPESPEAVAAGFHAADAHLAAGENEEALSCLSPALRHADPKNANPYLELALMRRMIDDTFARWFEAGQFDLARRLLEPAGRIALPGETDRRLAQACVGAAKLFSRQAERAVDGSGEELHERARKRYIEAGDALGRLAEQHAGQSDHAELLWSAAECYLKAQHYPRARGLLERCLAQDLAPDRRLEAMVGLAEALEALHQTDEAVKLLKEVLAKPGLLHVRPRFLLALTQIDQERNADAEEVLRELLALPVPDPEPAELCEANFALGYVLSKQAKNVEAIAMYEESLKRYPAHSKGTQARFRLAEVCRLEGWAEDKRLAAADTKAAREFFERRKRQYLEKALAIYRQLVAELGARQLKKEQQSLLAESTLGIGECLCALGKQREAIDVYERLAESYANHPDGAMALLQLARCHVQLGDGPQARQALERCRSALRGLQAKDFLEPNPARAQWDDWLDTVARSVSPTR